MISHGRPPFLECSSKGDKRFSAFFARLRGRNNRSIEEVYQAAKLFRDGSVGLPPEEAKGRKPVNIAECANLYSRLWDEYISENPELLPVLREASGLSDLFGQEGHQCQATELWRIRGLRTIIAGPRDFTHYPTLQRVMRGCPWHVSEVVSGRARGVDTLGEQWADENGIPKKLFPSDWNGPLGRGAGLARNIQMAEYADALVAINTGSRGTHHMIETARKRGLQVLVASIKPNVKKPPEGQKREPCTELNQSRT